MADAQNYTNSWDKCSPISAARRVLPWSGSVMRWALQGSARAQLRFARLGAEGGADFLRQ
jgi:hypothetical protein